MKKMNCIDCGKGEFEAGSPDEMMKVMMPHYQEEHKEMMEKGDEESKKEWMKKFHEEWDKVEKN